MFNEQWSVKTGAINQPALINQSAMFFTLKGSLINMNMGREGKKVWFTILFDPLCTCCSALWSSVANLEPSLKFPSKYDLAFLNMTSLKMRHVVILLPRSVHTSVFDPFRRRRSSTFCCEREVHHHHHRPRQHESRRLTTQKSFSSAPKMSAVVGGGGGIPHKSFLRRGENRITRIALAIVWLFLCCHIVKVVPTFYAAVYSSNFFGSSEDWPPWLRHINDLSHLLIVFNSAVNFLLYTLL